MLVTSVVGHVMEMDFDDRFRRWTSCEPIDIFDAPIHRNVAADKRDVVENFKSEARSCDMLIIWTDCDREGESIGFEIINECRKVRPQIVVRRARFSAVTNQCVLRLCALLLADS
jgi:DNA topoisomerase III